jgi:hypothetical protein
MNHKKAIPANGNRFRARLTVSEERASQSPASCGLAGTEIRTSTKLVMSNTENKIPAIAAARGVVNLDLAMVGSRFIIYPPINTGRSHESDLRRCVSTDAHLP